MKNAMTYEISKRATGEVLWTGEAYSRAQALRNAGIDPIEDDGSLFILVVGS